ncbi:hypothetical protein BDR05DRAFT_1048371 [Suillus weaverae]|nr:hypothetical protein BDR05DRAFT_1048371 [Suillus weaverae]
MYKLKCMVLGDDPSDIFPVNINIAQTQTVGDLKKVIKDETKPQFDHVAAHLSSGPLHLKLNCFVWGDDPRHVFEIKIAPTESVSALQKVIKDTKKLAFHDVDADGLELRQVKINLNDLHLLHAIGDVGVELKPLTELSEVFTDGVEGGCSPSAGAKPSVFSEKQDKQEYLCNCPRRAADPVPVTLLEPIFAQFVDDCQNHQSTACDNDFVRQLSEKMSSFYPDELTQMNAFRQVLRDYGIILNASIVGSTKCMTDRHLLSTNGKFVQMIVEGMNKIGSGTAEPFAKVHSDVLVPIIPLFWHSTDLHMQVVAARTFGALKIAIGELTNLHSNPIPLLKYEDQSMRCPYPRRYTNSSGHVQDFSYDKTQILRDRLIFFGETVHDAAASKICIKFVRHYSPEAHKFCASKGHAPKLIAYNHLPGGWNMVIMNPLDIDNDCFPQWPGSYRLLSEIAVLDRQPLKEATTSLIRELHKYNDGYVHGDLRDTNFVVVAGDNKHFILLDFD